jgi:predicted ribosome quality control (RQC) complex YloA/Tae2 family protein
LASELRATVLGWWIKEVFIIAAERTAILEIRQGKSRKYLLLSAHPEFCRVELLEKTVPNLKKRPHLFTSIQGGQITEISQLDFDRALRFSVEKKSEIGATREYQFVLELTGPQANLVLVDARSGKISQCLRVVKPGKERSREIAPGKLYSLLPKQAKLSPLELNSQKLSSLIEREPGKSFEHLLGSNIWGFNDSIIKEIAARSGIGLRTKVREPSSEDLTALSGAIDRLYSLSPSEKENATVIVDKEGNPKELLFYLPTEVFEKLTRRFPSLLEATGFFYRSFIKTKELQRGWSMLTRKVSSLIAKTSGRKELLQQRLSESQQRELYKICGDLLMLQADKRVRGRKGITIDNIFKTPPEIVTIKLDPKMSILENARGYYKRFRKAVAGEKKLEMQLQKISSELEILKRAKESLESAPAEPLLLSLKSQLAPLGITDTPQKVKRTEVRAKVGTGFRPREFVTSDGWRVLVGRSAKENDYLTFKIASREDFWFHARGAFGSHVVLKRLRKKSQPSKSSVEEAASLAAYFSKQRTSSKVSVSYTLVKHLRKPRRAKPGLVLVEQEESIMVEPRLLRRLESSGNISDQS